MKLPKTETSAEDGWVRRYLSHFDASVCDLPRIELLWPNFAVGSRVGGGSSYDSWGIICDDIISDDKHAILPCRCSLAPFLSSIIIHMIHSTLSQADFVGFNMKHASAPDGPCIQGLHHLSTAEDAMLPVGNSNWARRMPSLSDPQATMLS